MTDSTAINPRGNTHSSGRTWLVAWLIWLAVVAVVTFWIWGVITARSEDYEPILDVRFVPSLKEPGKYSLIINGIDGDREVNADRPIVLHLTAQTMTLAEVRSDSGWYPKVRHRFRMIAATGFAVTALLSGLAVTLYVRWNLGKWIFADRLRLSLMGGFFAYLAVWFQFKVVPEDVTLHWLIRPAALAISYGLIVVTLAAIRERLEGKLGAGAKVGRGILAAIAIVFGLGGLAAIVIAFLGKLLMIALK